MPEPLIPICPHCASTNITADSLSRWDANAQRWEHSSQLDTLSCDDCGKEFHTPQTSYLTKNETDARRDWLNAERLRAAAPDLLAAAKAALATYRHPMQVDDPTRAALALAILKAEG